MPLNITKNEKNFALIAIDDSVFIHAQVQEFNKVISELKAESKKNFIIDMTNCDYISSEGLGAIAEIWRWCHDNGNGKIALIFSKDPNNEIKYLFDIIGLSLAMKGYIFSDLKSAEKLMLNS